MENTYPLRKLQYHYSLSLFPSSLSEVCLWPSARWCHSAALTLHIPLQFKKWPLCCDYVLISHTHFSLDYLSPPPTHVPWHLMGYLGENQSNQSLWCILIILLLLCCGCKCIPNTAELCSGPVPAAKCRRQKGDTVTLKSNCGVIEAAQLDCGSLASFLCLREL